MSCLGSAILKTLLKVFGKSYTVEEVSEYADFYWKFMEVETTASEDLPGFSSYHNMLRNFIKKHQELAIDDDSKNGKNADNSDDIYEYTKVMRWLSNETYKTNNEFTDIQTWLGHQNGNYSDNNSTKDVTNSTSDEISYDKNDSKSNYSQTMRNRLGSLSIHSNDSDACSIYTTSAPWEVTRKPPSQQTTNSCADYQDSIWV